MNIYLSEIPFKIMPELLEFKHYAVGKVYESTVELKNIGTVAYQLRAIPPKTQYFCLSLGKF